MIGLTAKIRKDLGKRAKSIKQAGGILAVVYGPDVKNISIQVDEKEFKKVFQKAGESSLIELSIDGEKDPSASSGQAKRPVLVHEIQKNPVSEKIIHIDFLQPSLKKEVEVMIPLVFKSIRRI